MKKLLLLIMGCLLIGILSLVFAVDFSNVVSTCDAEDTEVTAGTFADACDAVDGSYLENNDGTLETHPYRLDEYAGVRIESANTSVVNCGSITTVEICYEWWAEADTLTNCDISVDANGGSNYTIINSTCPGTTANPGVICSNVTSNETWACSSFFTSSGTKALAKSELTRSNGGVASTTSWDVFFFNVTYELDNTPPSLNLTEPQNISYTTTSIDLNFSVSDLNLDSCWYSDDGGTTNITIVGCANTTYTASQDSTTINIYANDTAGNLNNTESVTFFVDSVFPLIDYASPSESSSNLSRGYIEVNVTASDTNQLDNITIRLYNSTFDEINSTNSTTSPLYINFSGLDEGTYYFNATATDNVSNQNSTSTRTIILDRTAPEYILNSPENDSISLDTYSLLNVTISDNLLTMDVKIYGADESGFYDNDSLLYKRTGFANNTEITYNWTAPVLNVTSDTQLLMHFDLEGNDNATFVHDETGQNNGTKKASGEPVWNESGKFAYALGFDGVDDIVTIADSDSLDLNESFSIAFWAYMTSVSENQTFLVKGSGTTINYYIDFEVADSNKNIEFGFYNGAFRAISVNASEIDEDEWNHIAVVWNESSNISGVYINGVDKGTLQLDYDVLANSEDLTLGYFEGLSQNYSGLIDELVIYNKTLTQTELDNIYTKDLGDWYWQVEINDTSGNLNLSETRTFTIGSVWEVSPTDLGSVGVLLNTNVTVGTLLINNTDRDRNVTIINITHDFDGTVTFNETFPLDLTNLDVGNNSVSIEVNVTSPTTEGSTTITFNISANDTDTGEDSVPASVNVLVDLIATSSQPFLITAFEIVPSIVSQNNSGITLKASVINRGQGDAQNVIIEFELPDGWTNSSGALSSSSLLININDQQNYSIEVNISDSATTGTVTLYANVTGQNSTGSYINSNFKTIGSADVIVNEVSSGTGLDEDEEITTTGGGGGSSSSSGGGSLESTSFTEAIEIVRGGDELSFDIEVTPSYVNTSLSDLTLEVTGFLEQYIEVFPKLISSIEYNETKNFTVVINAPSYKGYEEHELVVTIRGNLIKASVVSSYFEKRTINLVIQEVSFEEVSSLLEKAEESISLMESRGFNVNFAMELFEQAQGKLEEKINNEVYDLAQEIIDIKNKAFFINNFIRGLVEIEQNPRKSHFLSGNVIEAIGGSKKFSFSLTGNVISTGNAVKDTGEANEMPLSSLITGNVVFSSESIRELLNLAIVAFERGDYELAEERAKSAKLMLILERQGNFALFFYLYWYIILISLGLFIFIGTFVYRKYNQTRVIKNIRDNDNEGKNVRDLMVKSQKDYFSGKISSEEYKRAMSSYKKKLVNLKKQRQKLREKRRAKLKPEELAKQLEVEKLEVEDTIKKLQSDYYVKKDISEEEYGLRFKGLTGGLAEIEKEKTGFELDKEEKALGEKKENVERKTPKKKRTRRGEKENGI